MDFYNQCKTCGKSFRVLPSQIRAGHGIFCSRACMNENPEFRQKRREHMQKQWAKPEVRELMEEAIARRSQSEKWKSAAHFQKGEDHPKFNGGKQARQQEMARYDYKKWRNDVFHRDNFTCCSCGEKGGRLTAHHVQPWAKSPELRYDVLNGQTLCETCHDKAHGLSRRPRIYKCIDCGKPKRFRGLSPRCRHCAALHSFSEDRRKKPKPCEMCGVDFVPRKPHNRFCGNICAGKHKARRITVSCFTCGKDIDRRPSEVEGHKNCFCSRACMGEARKGVPRGTLQAS